MSRFTSRPYAGKADLQAMIDLLIAARPIERITDYPSVADLHHLFGQSETVANTRLTTVFFEKPVPEL